MHRSTFEEIGFNRNMRRGIIIFFAVVLMAIIFSCKTKSTDPIIENETATTVKSETGIPPVTDYDENPYFTIEYFYRGTSPTTHIPPFERCTREGDYMILTKKTDKEYSKPVLGIRVYLDDAIAVHPDIDSETFVVVEDAKALVPRIQNFENDKVWLAEINWDMDPDWRVIHIAQNVFGTLNGKRVGATARFQLDIQDQEIDWTRWPQGGSIGRSAGGFEVCPP